MVIFCFTWMVNNAISTQPFCPVAHFSLRSHLLERHKTLLTDNIDLLKQSFEHVKQSHPFNIDAIVILPEHLHSIWTLPETDTGFAMRWRLIKSTFSKGLPKDEHINKTRHSKNERGIWQRRYWEHLIRRRKRLYEIMLTIFITIQSNMVMSIKPSIGHYSSIHKFVRDGIIDQKLGI